MRAIRVHQPGPPEVLQLEELAVPAPSLPWNVLAALPETWLTAWGSVVEAMGMASGHTLLVRGATSSVGMAATSPAKYRGVRVLATTRAESKA